MRAMLLRRWMGGVRRWPLHPQWLIATSDEAGDLQQALRQLDGTVIDIGCAGRRLAGLVPGTCRYVGVDYPDTALHLYETRPDVFADACALPFASGSIDAVILKDVLEHVCGPHQALSEIARVLRDGGRLVLWMPFIYPIHDAPHDFQRFTEHGLHAYLGQHGLKVGELKPVLAPVETAAVMLCLAFADAGEQILARRRRYLPVLPVLALLVLLTNLFAKAFSWLPHTRFMPAFYRVLAVRDVAAVGGARP
jgi:SAM-dependent methyltransferase